jgi:hypothetical protein
LFKFILSFILILTFQANAKVTCNGGVDFQESMTVRTPQNKNVNLYLNGVGLKKVLIVNVFYGALYLENLSQSGSQILGSNQVKLGIIHTLRAISKSQIVNMWDDEFKRLCGNYCAELQPYHNKFLSYARNTKKGERLYVLFFPDRFVFEVNGNETFEPIKSPRYSNLMQRVLIGPEAEDKSLEDGLLGKKLICTKS